MTFVPFVAVTNVPFVSPNRLPGLAVTAHFQLREFEQPDAEVWLTWSSVQWVCAHEQLVLWLSGCVLCATGLAC